MNTIPHIHHYIMVKVVRTDLRHVPHILSETHSCFVQVFIFGQNETFALIRSEFSISLII